LIEDGGSKRYGWEGGGRVYLGPEIERGGEWVGECFIFS